MTPACDGLLFDLDGTLVDSLPDLTTAINLLRSEHQLCALTRQQVREYVGDGARTLVQRALPEGAFNTRMLTTFLDHYRRHLCEQTRVYPGIPSLLETLRDTPKAIVTNKPRAMAEELVQRLGLAPHFQMIIGGDSCRTKKPDPEPLQAALAALDLKPEQALMVGDHHTDLRAAKAAHIDALFCGWGYGHDGGETPRYRAATTDELARLLGTG